MRNYWQYYLQQYFPFVAHSTGSSLMHLVLHLCQVNDEPERVRLTHTVHSAAAKWSEFLLSGAEQTYALPP